jgi:ankyrin repeat protein
MVQKLVGSRIAKHMRKVMHLFHKPATEKMKLSPEKQIDLNEMLKDAVLKGKLKRIERLLKAGAEIEAKDKDGITALIWAAHVGGMEACRLLIEKGAKVDAKDKMGWTALMFAARWRHTDICKLLIENGADVNAKVEKEFYKGMNALMIARSTGRTETVAFLGLVMLMGKDGFNSFYSPFKECISS